MSWISPKRIFVILSVFLIGQVLSQDPGCDFFQNVVSGSTYQVLSPNYPGSYQQPSSCRWQFQASAGYQIRIDCLLEMPQTPGCTTDKFMVSRTGDPQFINAESYCGRTNLTGIMSVNHSLSIELEVLSNSPGGHFMCNVTAQATTPTPSCSCGVRKQDRIVGGTAAGANEFTMMGGLVLRGSTPAVVMCGAVILTSSYVMTAAHCLENLTPASLQVIVGNSNKDQAQRYDVLNFTIHPSYNSNTYDNDIAVLGIQGQITFNLNVGPVCLPFKFANTDITGRNLTMLGWGTIFFGGPMSANLLKVDVTAISQQQCLRTNAVTDRQLCTLTPGKDSCQDDSGGPCLLTDPETGRLFTMGVISYGDGCAADTPSQNTRVTKFLSWIVANAPGPYCSVQ